MTHPQDTMTGAELQTLREAVGLDRDELAALADVQARTVKHWEQRSGGVPADVTQLVRDLDRAVTQGAAAMLERVQFEHMGQDVSAPVILNRYRHTDDMPKGNTMPAAVHAAMLGRVRLALEHKGRAVRVVWFDASMASDTERLNAQAKPHRADQPSA